MLARFTAGETNSLASIFRDRTADDLRHENVIIVCLITTLQYDNCTSLSLLYRPKFTHRSPPTIYQIIDSRSFGKSFFAFDENYQFNETFPTNRSCRNRPKTDIARNKTTDCRPG